MSRMFFVSAICFAFMAVSQNYTYPIEQRFNVNGQAVSIDSVGNVITLENAVDELGNLSETKTFIVNENTKITRAGENIMLDEVDINDSLTIEYYKDTEGNLIAVKIIDNNLANE